MTGLVSISFRKLTNQEIINATHSVGLDAIEWGGDVHVPAGNVSLAKETRQATGAAGLVGYSYGSYYRIGASAAKGFEDVLMSADTLGTNVIRAWAYNRGSGEVSDWEYQAIVRDAQRICDMAKEKTICLECHNNTLTDDYRSAQRFIHDVDRENLAMYWQPNQYRDFEYNLAACKAVAPMTKSVHVFSWEGDMRFPLAEHAPRWRRYIEILQKYAPDAPMMLEFMHDDRPESLAATAAVLLDWLT